MVLPRQRRKYKITAKTLENLVLVERWQFLSVRKIALLYQNKGNGE